MKLTILTLLLGIMLIGMASAEVNEYAPVKQGDCVTLKQTCGSCTYSNITISYPNSTLAKINTAMASSGGGIYTYDFCNTSSLGRYDVMTCGDIDGVHKCTEDGTLWFEVTPSGSLMKDGDSLVLFGSLLVMVILSTVFLYVASKTENIAGRVALYCISSVGYIMAVLYTVVTIQQILFGFDSIINGIETFLFVGKIGLWIGFIALLIVILLIMLKAWKI